MFVHLTEYAQIKLFIIQVFDCTSIFFMIPITVYLEIKVYPK